MEDCSKTSAGATSGLPDDPLLEILSRVPAKSVCRFKCVSKAWRDLIDDPDNRKKLRQAMQGLFLQTQWHEDSVSRFSFIDLTVRSVPLDIDPSFSFLTEMAGIRTFMLDSCNGLILFGHDPERPYARYYTVCNPTTKEWSTVPACGSRGPLTYAYLAFAPDLSSHFHVVQIHVPDVQQEIESLHVYSSETGSWSPNLIEESRNSSETGSWSPSLIDEQKEQGQLEGWHYQFTLDIDIPKNVHAFVNGFLHLIVIRSDLQRILVVDVQGKARRMIAVPGMADGRPKDTYVCYLGQSQGHLHCVTIDSADENNNKLCTWVLQDYDTHEWVLKNTLDLNSLGLSEFEVVDIHQDCNVVFFLLESSCKLYAYDMDRKEGSVIATFKDDKSPWDFARYVPYFS